MFQQSTNIGKDLFKTSTHRPDSHFGQMQKTGGGRNAFPTWNNRALRVAMLPGQFGSSLWRLTTGRHHASDTAMVVTSFWWSGKVNI